MALEQVAEEAGVDVPCIKIIAKWEGCLKKVAGGKYGPYLCPANVPTIGYGTTVWPDGRKVTLQDKPITHARCEEVLAYDIGKRYAPGVDRHKLPWQYENQRSACISFAYNVGTGGFGKSTLKFLIAEKRYQDAAQEFLKWTRGGGRVLPGLVNRRNDERRLFLTPGGVSRGQTPTPETTPAGAETAPVSSTEAAPPIPAPMPSPPQPAPVTPTREPVKQFWLRSLGSRVWAWFADNP